MTTSERQERNETILQGKDPGPTKFKEWRDRNAKHWQRPVVGLIILSVVIAAVSLVAGAVYVSFVYPHIAVWTLAPAAVLALAYGIGVVASQ